MWKGKREMRCACVRWLQFKGVQKRKELCCIGYCGREARCCFVIGKEEHSLKSGREMFRS